MACKKREIKQAKMKYSINKYTPERMLNKMKDSKSALKIKKLICMFLILVTLGANVTLFAENKGEIVEVSNIKLSSLEKEDVKVKSETKVAQTTNAYERTTKVTSRTEVDRTKTTIQQEEVIEEVQYKTIEEIEISRDMDLTQRCGISREDFIKLMENMKVDYSGFFAENAGDIYDLCGKYEINEIFLCGLIAAESGWNIASSHRNAHNYISMMSGGRLIRYASAQEGLEAATKLLHNRYLTPGGGCYYGKTLSSVQTRFCPGSSTWVGLVYGCMKQVIK